MNRDRFCIRILPGMPATREGRMRVPSIEAIKWIRPTCNRVEVVGHYCQNPDGGLHEWVTDAVGGECDPSEVIRPPKKKRGKRA